MKKIFLMIMIITAMLFSATYFKSLSNVVTVNDSLESANETTANAYTVPSYSSITVQVKSWGFANPNGASIYFEGSLDDIGYSVIDSLAIDSTGSASNPVQIMTTNTLYKYFKVYCKYYDTGKYQIKFLGGR